MLRRWLRCRCAHTEVHKVPHLLRERQPIYFLAFARWRALLGKGHDLGEPFWAAEPGFEPVSGPKRSRPVASARTIWRALTIIVAGRFRIASFPALRTDSTRGRINDNTRHGWEHR